MIGETNHKSSPVIAFEDKLLYDNQSLCHSSIRLSNYYLNLVQKLALLMKKGVKLSLFNLVQLYSIGNNPYRLILNLQCI